VPKEELYAISYSSERMIPGKSDWKVELQHQIRYNFLAPLSRGKKALDAGCGEGYGAYAISGYAQSATAIERDQETFTHARSLYKRDNLDYQKGDLLTMDLQGTYDCIYSLGVLEQADDAEIVLSRLKGALGTDGLLVLSTSNKKISSPDSAMPANPFHKMEWTAVDLEKLLCSYFDHVILLGQSDEGIRTVADMSATRDPHFIALCSRKPVTGVFEKLQDEWNEKKTSIVVVSCNSLEAVKQCTAALIRYTYHPYEIIAVDNASKDGSADYLKTVAHMLVQRKENIGYWGACMEGIVSTSSPYIALLHSDVVVSHNWLGKLLEPLRSSPEAAITGPFSNRAPDTQKHKVIYENVEEFLKYARVVEMEHFGRFSHTDTLSDFCMVLKREALQKAGFSRLEMPLNQKKLFKAIRKAGLYLALKEDTFIHHKDK
jgi:SAM-dependent methyltransferase